jgi:glutathione S-transferase
VRWSACTTSQTLRLVGSADTPHPENAHRIRLWNTGVWPWAQRAWIALEEAGVPFEHKLISLQEKPRDFLQLHASIPGGGTGQVPLLEIDERVVIESEAIVRHIALELGHTELLPPGGRGHVERFIRLWTDTVEPCYYSVLTASDEKTARFCAAGLVDALVQVENALWEPRYEWGWQMTWSKRGDFLLGDAFSLAECMAAPWVERMLLMLPHWRGIDPAGICDDFGLVRTRAWMLAVTQRPSVVQTSAGRDEMVRASRRYYVSYVTPGAPGVLD